jgi:histone H3/H4
MEDLDGNIALPEGMDEDDDDHVNEPMDIPDFDTEDEAENVPEDHNTSIVEQKTISHTANMAPKRVAKKKSGKKISRHGIEYPSLPANVVKRLATTLAKTAGLKGKISPGTLDEMMQATDWFFEQLGDSLSAYAKHAGRNTINDSDIITLMRRSVIHSSTVLDPLLPYRC